MISVVVDCEYVTQTVSLSEKEALTVGVRYARPGRLPSRDNREIVTLSLSRTTCDKRRERLIVDRLTVFLYNQYQ